jgi:hypothetical protein
MKMIFSAALGISLVLMSNQIPLHADSLPTLISKDSPDKVLVDHEVKKRQANCGTTLIKFVGENLAGILKNQGLTLLGQESAAVQAKGELTSPTHILAEFNGNRMYIPLHSEGNDMYSNLLEENASFVRVNVKVKSSVGIISDGFVDYKVWSFINLGGSPAASQVDSAGNIPNPLDVNKCELFLQSETFISDLEIVLPNSSTRIELPLTRECRSQDFLRQETITPFDASKIVNVPAVDPSIGAPIAYARSCSQPDFSFQKKVGFDKFHSNDVD